MLPYTHFLVYISISDNIASLILTLLRQSLSTAYIPKRLFDTLFREENVQITYADRNCSPEIIQESDHQKHVLLV